MAADAIVLTGESGKYQLPEAMRDKLVLLSSGDVFVNENYRDDDDVLFELAFYNNIKQANGQNFTTKDKINYITPEEIRSYYDENQKLVFFTDSNAIQREITTLITRAYNEKATDIHIVLFSPVTEIYFRIMGALVLIDTRTYKDGSDLCSSLYNTMTSTSGTEYNASEQQDGNMMGHYLPEGLAAIRIATGPTQGGNSFMVLRLLPKGKDTRMEDLGYSRSHLNAFKTCMASNNEGITLICGPTGSGKSTTMQALAKRKLKEVKGTINFLTIEDPVEYPIVVDDNVEVIEVVDDKAYPKMKKITYAARQVSIQSTDEPELKKAWYLKAVIASVRQDPDRVMIGEIRDATTADAAINLSNTGHPVLATLHASNTLMIIDRLEKIGADRNLVLSPGMIKGLFAQKLVSKLCPKCKRKLIDHIDELEPDLIERLETTFKDHGGLEEIYIRGTYTLRSGCGYHDKDNDLWCISGYIDRMVVAEFIMPDSEFLQLMYDRRLLDAGKHWFNNLGGYTMMTHGLAKVKAGILDPRTLEEQLEQISPQINLDKAIDDVI